MRLPYRLNPKVLLSSVDGLVKDLVEQDTRTLCDWKGCEVIELNVQADHVHWVVSTPPRVSVSELTGSLKDKFKLAIKLFKS